MLRKCMECGKDVSSNADVCPNCGNPVKTAEELIKLENELVKEGLKGGTKLLLIGVGIVLLLFAILIFLINSNII